MQRPTSLRGLVRNALGATVALAFAAPLWATEYYYVPSIATPTLQSAVSSAAASAEDEHVVFISETLVTTGPVIITFDGDATCSRSLTVRPSPELERATIVSTGAGSDDEIIKFVMASCVTLEDLDLLRAITNNENLVYVDTSSDILIQRCRIGSIWSAPGSEGWSNLKLNYPTRVVVRNCIFFALAPGTFDRGIYAVSWGDPANSLWLYNNVVADYEEFGISIVGPVFPGQLILLRNNVVLNEPGAIPEPDCFESDIGALPTVISSHNTGFGSGFAFLETISGVQAISGLGTGTFVGFPSAAVVPAFVEHEWIAIPPEDPNVDFFRLEFAGPLHDGAVDFGATVLDGAPAAPDIAVTDDIEKDGRPGGAIAPMHTDRGADQVDPGVVADIGPATGRNGVLWAAPHRNPTRSNAAVLFRSERAGHLVLEIFDVAGRRLDRTEREVAAGHTGMLECRNITSSGVLHYRLRLTPREGSTVEVRGKMVVTH